MVWIMASASVTHAPPMLALPMRWEMQCDSMAMAFIVPSEAVYCRF